MKRSNLRSSVLRWIPAVVLLVGSALLIGSNSRPDLTAHDKAYYADPKLVSFVRPGLTVKILSAAIGTDGTVRARLRVTDLKGLPLDREGIVTPGVVTIRLIAAHIPKNQTQYRSYTTSATTPGQPAADVNGVFERVAEGEYQYTFATKVPASYDRTVTHTIGVQANRNLTEFDLGTQVDNDVFHFVPDGSKVVTTRDVVRTATCNGRCHDPLAIHGGNRRKVELCVLCHQPQNVSRSGNPVDFPVLIHKIHRGADLPSVKAGGSYAFSATNDFSSVVFPAGVRNCEVCHDPKSGAAQADAWLKPNRNACGACHDDVNFATGAGHVDLPQVSDSQCANCHIPQGELEFDASIRGAHLDSRFSRDLPGTVFEVVSVSDGVAGKRPTVTFTVKDKAGNPIPLSAMDRLTLVLAGPTTDYSFFVSEDVRQAEGVADGRNYWTFRDPIAPAAKGTYSIGIEGYRSIRLLPGTKKEQTVRDAGMNKLAYFSVDGSKVLPRRTVVQIEKCNSCHLQLEFHGRNRNQTEYCVRCHNVNQTDAAGRPAAAGPAQAITFKVMIHSIHTGADLTREFAIYSGSGRKFDFSDVRFPGDRRNCAKCHVNGSEQLPLPDYVSKVNNPRAPF
ncbi:MAG: OmcA/MtrC family decaheme c-type cytochrome, partial [Bryobacterales bacterium]|nr:OmcA/MtrC family decaheme c-type cytochrome [Bryobacterales bacterium]